MKFFSIILSFFVLLLILALFPPITNAQNTANCLKMDVKIEASNWPGGTVNVWCAGDTGQNCTGSNKSGTPGETVQLDRCSCPPYADGCLEASFPAQCTEVISGPRCGTNGNTINPTITVNCPAPPNNPPACQVGATCGQNECSIINCNKAYPRKFDSNCNCVVDQSTQVDDTSCTQAVTCPSGTPPTSTPPTSTPPTLTPPTTTPPISTPTVTNPPVTQPPTPTPTPTPPFNEAMCKCDSIDFTPITLGQKTTVTAYGKVEGTDTQFAKIPSFRFAFFAGNDTSANALQRQTVTTTQIENTQTKARYKAVWELQIPSTLDAKKVYRIQATPSCVRKTAAIALPVNPTTAVLAATDENTGFFSSIVKFFAGLFGRSNPPQEPEAAVQDSANTPNQQPNLQIGTFKPLIATKETDANNCSFIRLQFAQ